jgi:hypothetical protein
VPLCSSRELERPGAGTAISTERVSDRLPSPTSFELEAQVWASMPDAVEREAPPGVVLDFDE